LAMDESLKMKSAPSDQRRRSARPAHNLNDSNVSRMDAHSPTEILPAGWRDVLLRVFHGITEDRITTIAEE
jgi:hypothetical protein